MVLTARLTSLKLVSIGRKWFQHPGYKRWDGNSGCDIELKASADRSRSVSPLPRPELRRPSEVPGSGAIESPRLGPASERTNRLPRGRPDHRVKRAIASRARRRPRLRRGAEAKSAASG